MTHQSAAVYDLPSPPSQTARHDSSARELLEDTPEFRLVRDEIEALLGAPTVHCSTPVSHIRDATELTPNSTESLSVNADLRTVGE